MKAGNEVVEIIKNGIQDKQTIRNIYTKIVDYYIDWFQGNVEGVQVPGLGSIIFDIDTLEKNIKRLHQGEEEPIRITLDFYLGKYIERQGSSNFIVQADIGYSERHKNPDILLAEQYLVFHILQLLMFLKTKNTFTKTEAVEFLIDTLDIPKFSIENNIFLDHIDEDELKKYIQEDYRESIASDYNSFIEENIYYINNDSFPEGSTFEEYSHKRKESYKNLIVDSYKSFVYNDNGAAYNKRYLEFIISASYQYYGFYEFLECLVDESCSGDRGIPKIIADRVGVDIEDERDKYLSREGPIRVSRIKSPNKIYKRGWN